MRAARRLALSIAAAGALAWPLSAGAQATSDPVAKAYAELGKELYYASEYDEAIVNLQKSVDRVPGNGEARLFLALAQTEKKAYPAAEDNLRKALGDPKVAQDRVRAALGFVYSAQKDYKKAEAEYRIAQQLSPKSPRYANSLAYMLALQGKNLDEGLQLINMALESTPAKPSVGPVDPIRGFYLDTRATLYFKQGKYADAERDQLEAVALAEKFTKARVAGRRYLLGQIYASSQQRDLARQEFEKVVKLDASHKEAAEALKKL